MSPRKPLVAICMPMQRDIHHRTHECIIDLIQQLTIAEMKAEVLNKDTIQHCTLNLTGRNVDTARNMITAKALEIGADYLMWIDSDMAFDPQYVPRLLAHRRPIVGGLCFGRRQPYEPILVRYQTERAIDTQKSGFVYDYPPNSLIPVDATGGAFLLVARKVFEQIPVTVEHQWWTPLGIPEAMGEDTSFCVRARRAGFPIYVDTTPGIKHIGEVEVDEEFSLRNRDYNFSPWIPPGLQVHPLSDDSKPVASIIIPTYNTPERYLQAAVQSALEQTVPCEIIVVDDGSGERATVPGAADGRVKVVSHTTNKGVSAALNSGFRAMTTDWFNWLSSDDILSPEKVERHLAHLLALDGKAGFTHYQIHQDDKIAPAIHPPQWLDLLDQRRSMSEWCWVNGSTSLIHRSVFERVGLFDETLRYSQDWDMWNRIAKIERWWYLRENLGIRRERSGNLTGQINADPAKQKAHYDEDRRIAAEHGVPHYDEWVSSLRK